MVPDNLSKLTDRQLEMVKLEVELLEQRIIHLENIQYHLRQFSVALWTLALGVGLGVSDVAQRDLRLLAASGLIPLVFLYLDAWYARAAQRFRTRRLEIAEYLNGGGDGEGTASGLSITHLVLLDFTASKVRQTDPKARYREHIAVKATRTIRVFFYGFQLTGTVLLCTLLWVSGQSRFVYVALAWTYFLPLAAAFLVRGRMQKTLDATDSAEDLFDLQGKQVEGNRLTVASTGRPASPSAR